MPNSTVTGFVTELNSTATQILYSTFLGGNNGDGVYGIALDAQGKIHVAGNTNSSNFPTTANAWDRTCGADGARNPYYDGAWHNAWRAPVAGGEETQILDQGWVGGWALTGQGICLR